MNSQHEASHMHPPGAAPPVVTPRSIDAQKEINAASIKRAGDIQTRLDPIINKINSKLAE